MTRPIATLFGLWIAILPSTGARSADGAGSDADWLRRAREQAEAVGEPAARAKLFGRIAVVSARLGDEAAYRRDIGRAKEAMAAAPETPEISPVDSADAEAIPSLIAVKVKAGDLRGAKALAEEHLKGRDAYRPVWMGPIAVAQAEAGDLDGAMATIDALGMYGRADALVGVAAALALRGDPQAGRVMGMLGDDGPTTKSDALGAIALAQAKAGQYAEALATLEKAIDGRVRVGYRAEVAEIQARAGNAEAARATAASLSTAFERDLAYTRVALVEIDRGEIAGARLTAAKVAGATHRAQLLRAIAEAEVRAGRLDDARRTANSIPADEQERRETFHILAAALARAGDLDGAVRVAEDQSEVEWLADIAFIALDRSRDAEARRIVDRLRRISLLHPEKAGPLGPHLAILEARLGDPTALDRLAGELDVLFHAELDADHRRRIEVMLFGLHVIAGRMGDARRLVHGKSVRDIDIRIAWAVPVASASGDLKRAEELTFFLPTPGPREPYIARLAVAHREAAGARAAAAWIDHLPTPHDRAAAYLGLADPNFSR
jgi:tetratricopeptide (TPR) repeat protein